MHTTSNDTYDQLWCIRPAMVHTTRNDAYNQQWYIRPPMVYTTSNDAYDQQWYIRPAMVYTTGNDAYDQRWCILPAMVHTTSNGLNIFYCCYTLKLYDWFFVLVAVDAYRWLVSFLFEESQQRLAEENKKTKCSFTGRNNSQVYYARSLALAFVEVSQRVTSARPV